MQHNNLSDLAIAISFTDESGSPCGIPVYDFEIEFFTNPGFRKVTASQRGGELTNCKVVDGVLTCFFDAPKLGRGSLLTRRTFHIPDGNFPDGYNTIVVDGKLDVEIV